MTLQPWPNSGSRRMLFGNPFLQIMAQNATNPRNGRTGTFYTVELPDCVCIIALTSERKMVCVRQFRHGAQTLQLELPGGCIEKDEDRCVAAARELNEETGYTPESDGVVISHFYTNPVLCNNHCSAVFFPCVRLTGASVQDPFENIEVELKTPREIFELYQSGAIEHGLIRAVLGDFFLRYPEYQS